MAQMFYFVPNMEPKWLHCQEVNTALKGQNGLSKITVNSSGQCILPFYYESKVKSTCCSDYKLIQMFTLQKIQNLFKEKKNLFKENISSK